MSETEVAFAERTLRSLKTMPYSYMEECEYMYIQNFSQFVTTLKSRKNCSIDLLPKIVKCSYFSTILYSKPLQEYRKPKFQTGHILRILMCDLAFKKGYQSQFTRDVFEIVAISSRKPPTNTKKVEQDENICGQFCPKIQKI